MFAAELDPERDRTVPPPDREPPYISTWVARDDTWETTEDRNDEDGAPVLAGTKFALLEGAEDSSQRRLAITGSGLVLVVKPQSIRPTDAGE